MERFGCPLPRPAGLKAKYGLASSLQLEAEAPCDGYEPAASPEPVLQPEARSEAPGGAPQPAPPQAASAGSPESAGATADLRPARDAVGAHSSPTPQPPQPPQPTGSSGSPTASEEDADYLQLLQLEALEEELTRQRLSALRSEEAAAGSALPSGVDALGMPGTSSMPELCTPTTTSSSWSGTPASQACVSTFDAPCPAGLPAGGAAVAAAAPSSAAGWTGAASALSQRLTQLGFPPIAPEGGKPDLDSLYTALASVLNECDRCSGACISVCGAARLLE